MQITLILNFNAIKLGSNYISIFMKNDHLFEKYKNLSSFDLENELANACEIGDIEVVKYLLTTNDLIRPNIKANNNRAVNLSCIYGYKDILEFLLLSEEINEHADMNPIMEYGFTLACRRGHLNVVRFLTTDSRLSNKIDISINESAAFRVAADSLIIDILEFFIFELNMEIKKEMVDFMKNKKNELVEKMFKTREYQFMINFELKNNKIDSKVVKI